MGELCATLASAHDVSGSVTVMAGCLVGEAAAAAAAAAVLAGAAGAGAAAGAVPGAALSPLFWPELRGVGRGALSRAALYRALTAAAVRRCGR